MKYCSNCGVELIDKPNFCQNCGNKLYDFTSISKNNDNPNTQVKEEEINQEFNQNQTNSSEGEQLKNEAEKIETKYDLNFKRPLHLTVFGCFLFIVGMLFAILNKSSTSDFGVGLLLIRIVGVLWVTSLAGDMNRNKIFWGVFALLFPSLSFIFIGLQRKLLIKIVTNKDFSDQENSKVLFSKAQEFKRKFLLSDSVRHAEAAVRLDGNNLLAKELLEKSKNEMRFLENNQGKDPYTVFRKTFCGKSIRIISPSGIAVGACIFDEDGISNDAIYRWRTDSGYYEIDVKSGKIAEKKIYDKPYVQG